MSHTYMYIQSRGYPPHPTPPHPPTHAHRQRDDIYRNTSSSSSLLLPSGSAVLFVIRLLGGGFPINC